MRFTHAALFALFVVGVAAALPVHATNFQEVPPPNGTSPQGDPVCDDIFNNFDGSSSFWQFSDPNSNDPYFSGATCNGAATVPTGVAVTGDLTLWNVQVGQTFTFSSCPSVGLDTHLRVWNAGDLTFVAENGDDPGCAGNPLASTVTWTSTFDGQVWVGVTIEPCDPSGKLDFDLSASCSPEGVPAMNEKGLWVMGLLLLLGVTTAVTVFRVGLRR